MSDRQLGPRPDDFEALESAVRETEVGRWFLDEFARRNRSADTGAVLGAIERLEGSLRAEPAGETDGDLLGRGDTAIASITMSVEKMLRISGLLRIAGIDPEICSAIDHLAARISEASAVHRDMHERLREVVAGLLGPGHGEAEKFPPDQEVTAPDLDRANTAMIEAISQLRDLSAAVPNRPAPRGDPLANLTFAEKQALFS